MTIQEPPVRVQASEPQEDLPTGQPEQHKKSLHDFLSRPLGRVTAIAAGLALAGGLTAGITSEVTAAHQGQTTSQGSGETGHHHKSGESDNGSNTSSNNGETNSAPEMSAAVQAAESADLATFESMPKEQQLEWMLYKMQAGNATQYEQGYESVTGDSNDTPPSPASLNDATNNPQNILSWGDLEARFAYTLTGDARTKFIVASLKDGAASPYYNQHSNELQNADEALMGGDAAVAHLVPAEVPTHTGPLTHEGSDTYVEITAEQENNSQPIPAQRFYYMTVGSQGVWISQ